MLHWTSSSGWQFRILVAVLFGAAVSFAIYRSIKRRKSLHRREDGVYVWIKWHGGERSSLKDPSKPGGAWDTDGDGGDGGDGD